MEFVSNWFHGREMSKFLDFVQNVWAKSCPPSQIICKPENILHSLKRPRYKFNTTVF